MNDQIFKSFLSNKYVHYFSLQSAKDEFEKLEKLIDENIEIKLAM